MYIYYTIDTPIFLLRMLYKNAIIFLVIIMKLNLQDWQKDIDDNCNLFGLDIPGAHDCAARYVPLKRLTKCQSMSIYQQLCTGVRALDVRVKPLGNRRLGMVHGLAGIYKTRNLRGAQMELGDLLENCYHFLDEHPGESIIFQFKNDNNKDMERCFANLFYTYIRGNESRWYAENRIPTLGEVRGKLVLVRRCSLDKSNPDFCDSNTGIDFSGYIEQDGFSPEPARLDTHSIDGAEFVIMDRFRYAPHTRWSKCNLPFLDSRGAFGNDGSYVICFFSTAGGVLGPQANAEYINSRFLDYPLDSKKYYGIMYFDFITPELAEKIISNNY